MEVGVEGRGADDALDGGVRAPGSEGNRLLITIHGLRIGRNAAVGGELDVDLLEILTSRDLVSRGRELSLTVSDSHVQDELVGGSGITVVRDADDGLQVAGSHDSTGNVKSTNNVGEEESDGNIEGSISAGTEVQLSVQLGPSKVGVGSGGNLPVNVETLREDVVREDNSSAGINLIETVISLGHQVLG